MKRIVPTLVTMTGLALGVWGALVASPGLLLLSLALDALDGWTARKLNATSAFGGHLDWSVDVFLAHLIALQFLGVSWCVVLTFYQAVALTLAERTSGRAMVALIASALLLLTKVTLA